MGPSCRSRLRLGLVPLLIRGPRPAGAWTKSRGALAPRPFSYGRTKSLMLLVLQLLYCSCVIDMRLPNKSFLM